MMTPYKKKNGTSGVTHFETGNDFIRIKFNNGSSYLYTTEVTGIQHIATMKALAIKGEGLSTYISKHVKDKYASKEN